MTDLLKQLCTGIYGSVRLRVVYSMDLDKITKRGCTIWWRVRDQWYAPDVDEFGDTIPGTRSMEILGEWFTVLKTTPKGVWLLPYGSSLYVKRFVLREVRKRYACPTLQEALESFIARKKRQKGVYKARMDAADLALVRGEYLLGQLLTMTSSDGESHVKR